MKGAARSAMRIPQRATMLLEGRLLHAPRVHRGFSPHQRSTSLAVRLRFSHRQALSRLSPRCVRFLKHVNSEPPRAGER